MILNSRNNIILTHGGFVMNCEDGSCSFSEVKVWRDYGVPPGTASPSP